MLFTDGYRVEKRDGEKSVVDIRRFSGYNGYKFYATFRVTQLDKITDVSVYIRYMVGRLRRDSAIGVFTAAGQDDAEWLKFSGRETACNDRPMKVALAYAREEFLAGDWWPFVLENGCLENYP